MRFIRTSIILNISLFAGTAFQAQARDAASTEESSLRSERRAKRFTRFYLVTRPDFRKCAYPMCGGYFVKELGLPFTRCADGHWRSECQAVETDFSALDLDPEALELFRQTFESGDGIVQGYLFEDSDPNIARPIKTLRVLRGWSDVEGAGA